MLDYLYLAAKAAAPTTEQDFKKNFRVGAIGIRSDGARIVSKNMPIMYDGAWRRNARTHAEGRVLRKMDRRGNGLLFVARLNKTGGFAMARPCELCQNLIRAYRIKRVYYTINDFQFGILDPQRDTDIVCTY